MNHLTKIKKTIVVNYGSEHYKNLVKLRAEILRKPLGLKFYKKDLVKEKDQIHFAYFEGKEILAGLILVPSEKGKIKMRQVCVANEKQGNGIGKDLVLFAENYAKENGFNLMYCHARKNALSFYSKLNYKIEGESFTEVGLEHYKLVKLI